MSVKHEVNFIELESQYGQHESYIDQVIELSATESMVPITHDTITKHHLGHLAIIEGSGDPVFVGYAAITHVYSAYSVELGGLIVKPDFRGEGIASELVSRVHARAIQTWPEATVIAFSNNVSRVLFDKLGGAQINDPDILPSRVWKVCESCVNYQACVVEQGQRCCGRIFDITDIEGHDD